MANYIFLIAPVLCIVLATVYARKVKASVRVILRAKVADIVNKFVVENIKSTGGKVGMRLEYKKLLLELENMSKLPPSVVNFRNYAKTNDCLIKDIAVLIDELIRVQLDSKKLISNTDLRLALDYAIRHLKSIIDPSPDKEG